MLLDNKTLNKHQLASVYAFLEKYTGSGKIDIVSGYFSIAGLARLAGDLGRVVRFRMVLGDIVEDKRQSLRTVNLLTNISDDLAVDKALQLRADAQWAITFLKRNDVAVKTVEPNFCHAKVYIYKEEDERNNFFVLGSSNLTYAGLGLKSSSNIELNIARHENENEYLELVDWYRSLWDKMARDYTIVDGERVPYKEFLIRTIQHYHRRFSPLELYYKTLYELFKEDIPDLEADAALNQQIGHLRDTEVFRVLYPFQKKGVLSLIRMMQRYNGAILADAVGLGKTWQALAVMKYFRLQGYEVLLLCPKKLEQNWRKYLRGHRSRFEVDRFDYVIRYHTDMQDRRLENKADGLKIKSFFQRNPKLLLVIDESHNFRNDKSNRYQFLVETLLQKNQDVKVLLLSATPINNYLTDVRNQFKLLCKGEDGGFEDTDLNIGSLEAVFRQGQEEFNKWRALPNRTIAGFIDKLPQRFFDLTDALIVARTRKLIANQIGQLRFPKKLPPQNEYVGITNLGKLHSFGSILDALRIYLTAYRPSEFMDASKPTSVLEDNMQREKFLVRMMYILLVKRLESSWHAFDKTVEHIYNHHINALQKVNAYLQTREEQLLSLDVEVDEEDLEDAAQLVETQLLGDDDPGNDASNPLEATLGKKRPIKISSIVKLAEFKDYLEQDITQLAFLRNNLAAFKHKFEAELEQTAPRITSCDKKLEKLISIIRQKQEGPNRKVVIFTTYKDTAEYLYEQLNARGFSNLGLITGTTCRTTANILHRNADFEPILEAFAPYTKLFRERDWSFEYEQAGRLPIDEYDAWVQFIGARDAEVKRQLNNPVDILVATDCISEGQNLQDCDCVINYDIHWNPVRLIQRLGRVDRLGSPNKEIRGINFWPGENYDEYLHLKDRVEDRMALLTLVGGEYDAELTPELRQKVKDNPLVSRQTEKMLAQLQTTWEDIDSGAESLGLDKLSLEEYRQDLFEFFQHKRDELESIPDGVFSGFRIKHDLFSSDLPPGLIALVRYKHTPSDEKPEHYLLYATPDGASGIEHEQAILSILKKHKTTTRHVPRTIDESEADVLQALADQISGWMDRKAGRQAVSQVQDLFKLGGQLPPKTRESRLLEEKFKNDNFDLVTWFVLT